MPAGPAPTATAGGRSRWSRRPPRSKPRKERSILGRLTLSALLLVLGVTAALDAGGAIDPEARHYLALCGRRARRSAWWSAPGAAGPAG